MPTTASTTATRLLLLAIGLTSATLLLVLLAWEPTPDLADTPRGGDFTLNSADGPVSLRDFRGKLVVLYFGYTRCPDICPTSLAYLVQGLSQLSAPEQQRVQVLFVSVDPQRDTLAHLKTYSQYFHPNFLGLTDSPERIKRVADQYGAGYRIVNSDSKLGYLVDHSADLYLIDRTGTLQGRIAHGTPPGEIAVALRTWLPEPANP
jgi:protein SCO1/2